MVVIVAERFASSRGKLVIILIGVLLSTMAGTARSDTLALNATALADCPACGTTTGGAQVVNYVEQLAPQTLSFSPADDATPPPEGWATSATSMANAEGDLADVASGATSAAADTVASGTEAIEVGAGAVPELCGTGFLCPIGLAVGAFAGGAIIGTGAKALFEHFFGGHDNNVDTSVTQERWQRNTSGSDIHVANSNTAVVHAGESYVTYSQYDQQWDYSWTGAVTGGECDFGPPPPSNTIVRTGTTVIRCSSNPPQPVAAYVRTPSMFVTHESPLVPASDADTTGATTYAAPAAPSRSAFETAATEALNDPNSHELRLWLQHELDSRCSPDPTTAEQTIPAPLDNETGDAYQACLTSLGFTVTTETLPESDLDWPDGTVVTASLDPGDTADPSSTPIRIGVNPPQRTGLREDSRCIPPEGGEPGADPGDAPADGTNWPQFQPAPPPVTSLYATIDPRNTPPTPTTVSLRWGQEKPGLRWGWQHITISHGYSTVDQAETADALANDPDPLPRFESTGQYIFHKYYDVPTGPGGTIHCVRSVPVQFGTSGAEPGPRHIMNSYVGIVDP